jgi:hypothetical protein
LKSLIGHSIYRHLISSLPQKKVRNLAISDNQAILLLMIMRVPQVTLDYFKYFCVFDAMTRTVWYRNFDTERSAYPLLDEKQKLDSHEHKKWDHLRLKYRWKGGQVLIYCSTE